MEKMLYSIGEVAEMFNVNVSKIRYWENEFDILNPKRNKKGNRLFTPTDIKHFHLIYYLVEERGMTLDGVKKKIKENKEDTENNFEIVLKLKSIRKQLIDIRNNMDTNK